jgi:signal transduction histidine kinase
MADKKLLFPFLLFGIFFFLIAITGFFQVTIIKRNIEGLLREEGETVFRSVAREVEVNMDYLSLLETSPSIITPNFLNVMTYDEAIVDDLFNRLISSTDLAETPGKNLLVLDRSGRQIKKRGSISISRKEIDSLLKGGQQVIITHKGDDLIIGVRMADTILFLRLSPEELKPLRKKQIVKSIIENEEKRLDIAEINIYDPSGHIYLASGKKPNMVLRIAKPLNRNYFPGYTMEILTSNRLAVDTYKKTSTNFVIILLFLAFGGAAGIYVIFRLERKHAERLSEMEKNMVMKERLVSLGRLASGMAHEIRNPLNAISISIQRLKREFMPEEQKKEEYHQFLDIVRGELLRVNKIVEEFLLSTKAGQPMEPEALRTIIEEVVTILREKAGSKHIVIENRSDADTIINCQKERMKQVFYNLITNSIEAMKRAGSIEISTTREDSMLIISIRDTGPGVRKEDLSRIFEYHYTTKDKGMGLGLPISYMIVKDHGGDIQAMSEEGKGTTFSIRLPMREEEQRYGTNEHTDCRG